MLDLQSIFLAMIVALLLAIMFSLKILFYIQRNLVRMDENLIRITAKLLEEEDEIELLLKEDLKKESKIKGKSKKVGVSKKSSKSSSKKSKSNKRVNRRRK